MKQSPYVLVKDGWTYDQDKFKYSSQAKFSFPCVLLLFSVLVININKTYPSGPNKYVYMANAYSFPKPTGVISRNMNFYL